MESDKLLKEDLKRAVLSNGSLATCSVALAATLYTMNPLPIAAWIIGSGLRLGFRVLDDDYGSKLAEQQFENERQLAKQKHEALAKWVLETLGFDPFLTWIGHQQMPDYGKLYAELEKTRDRITRQAHARRDVAVGLENDVHKQMNLLLAAYLRFVQSRIIFIQQLTGLALELGEPVIEPDQEQSFLDWVAHYVWEPTEDESEQQGDQSWNPDPSKIPPLDLTAKLNFLRDKRSAKLHASKRDGAAARITAEHADMLGKRIAFLEDIAARDQRAVAQLEALPDIFFYMMDRIGSAQMDASSITLYMNSVVERVEADQEFVEEMAPHSDQLIRDMEQESLQTL